MLRVLICDDVMMWNPKALLGPGIDVTTATSRSELAQRIEQQHGRGAWDLALVDMVWDRPEFLRGNWQARPDRHDPFDGVDALQLLVSSGLVHRAVIHSVGGPGHRLWIEEAARSPIVRGSICKSGDGLAALVRSHLTARGGRWDPLIPEPPERTVIDVLGNPPRATSSGRTVAALLTEDTSYEAIAARLHVSRRTARKYLDDLRDGLVEVGEIGEHLLDDLPQRTVLQWVNQHRSYLLCWARRAGLGTSTDTPGDAAPRSHIR